VKGVAEFGQRSVVDVVHLFALPTPTRHPDFFMIGLQRCMYPGCRAKIKAFRRFCGVITERTARWEIAVVEMHDDQWNNYVGA
jgi:hypothetical protein